MQYPYIQFIRVVSQLSITLSLFTTIMSDIKYNVITFVVDVFLFLLVLLYHSLSSYFDLFLGLLQLALPIIEDRVVIMKGIEAWHLVDDFLIDNQTTSPIFVSCTKLTGKEEL